MEAPGKRKPEEQGQQPKQEPTDDDHLISPSAPSIKKTRHNTITRSVPPTINDQGPEGTVSASTGVAARPSSESPFGQLAAEQNITNKPPRTFGNMSSPTLAESRFLGSFAPPPPPRVFPTAATPNQSGNTRALITSTSSRTTRAASFAAGSNPLVNTPSWPSPLLSNSEVTETPKRLEKLEGEVAQLSRSMENNDRVVSTMDDRVDTHEEKVKDAVAWLADAREEARMAVEQQAELRSVVERQAEEIRQLRAEKNELRDEFLRFVGGYYLRSQQ